MEVTLGSIVITFALIAILPYAWRVLDFVWFRPKKQEKLLRQQGLNGNPYRLLIGDSKDMINMSIEARRTPINLSDDIVARILPFHHHIIEKYGKNSFTWIGPFPMVNIMDPELIKEMFLKNNIFTKVVLNPQQKFLLDGLVFYEGEKWVKTRKILNPAFYAEKLKHMVPAMCLSCTEMIISEWEILVADKSSCELDVMPYLSKLTSDVIARTAFGSNYEEGIRIFELQKSLADLTGSILFSYQIPGWRYVPTKTNKRMQEVNQELQALVRVVVNKREEIMKSGEIIKDDDLLGMLLKSNCSEIKEQRNKDAGMSNEDVVHECRLFFFAGQEAATQLLVWAMVLLSMHPNWQVRAREEVQQVFGNNKPDPEGLSRLKIMTMILHEVLRLYPPAIFVPRAIQKETKLGEMNLPAGVYLMLPIIFMHHDFGIWGEDAKEFKPERFSEGVAKATKNQLTYFPFGWGPRICIGNNYGMMEAKIALAMILQRFSFELSPSYTHAPSFVISLQPQNGARLFLRKLQY